MDCRGQRALETAGIAAMASAPAARALVFCLLFAWALVACDRVQPSDRPTRIVLVTLDTLRFDRLDPRSDRVDVMPRTRAFAERGAWFTRFWSASSTTQPTHATLFTGLHPWQHGVPRNGTVLSDRHHTVAERLREAGYATAAVVASFPLDPRFGYAQGFDVFLHEFDHVLTPRWEGKWSVEAGRFYRLDAAVTEQALRLLDEAPDTDQFFWFHYFDPHEPYGDLLPEPLGIGFVSGAKRRGADAYEQSLETVREQYDGDVRRLDGSLGVLIERLDEDADRFETHVVITADHGESFGEHGALGHGWRVTREQVQVPLAIVSPRVRPAIRDDVAGTADLTTTILSFAGLGDPGLPGRDLALEPDGEETVAVGMTGVPAHPLDPASGGRRERFFRARGATLYSGTSDQVVEEDVVDRPVADEQVALGLRTIFREFESELSGKPVVERTDEETQEALRALGYAE
jgi:arylsulfatase A-like enzyme